MEVSGQHHAPVALPPVKDRRYPLDRRFEGPQSSSGKMAPKAIPKQKLQKRQAEVAGSIIGLNA
jgi:hypothetical protein